MSHKQGSSRAVDESAAALGEQIAAERSESVVQWRVLLTVQQQVLISPPAPAARGRLRGSKEGRREGRDITTARVW